VADTGYKPLRIKVASAAKLLDLKLEAVRDLIHDGTFTAIAPNGRGRGKRLYLVPAEVEAYATGGRAAVEKVRAKRGRK
jgi:hypothetical protein